MTQLKRQATALEKELPEVNRAAKDELQRMAAGPRALQDDLQRRQSALLAHIEAALPAELLQEAFAVSLASVLVATQSELVPIIADLIGPYPEPPVDHGKQRAALLGTGSATAWQPAKA